MPPSAIVCQAAGKGRRFHPSFRLSRPRATYSCKRSPYHYTVDCDSVMATAREWSSWLTQGKAAFLQAMAARDDEHKALLDQHNKRKQEHDCAVKEVSCLKILRHAAEFGREGETLRRA